MEKEFFDSIESPEQMDFSITLVEEDSTSPIKQLVTDTVAILYFNFVERFKMVDKIGDYFAENFQVQEDNIIFAMPETSQDSKDMSMVEFKKAFIEGQKIESILKRIIYIANKNGLLIDNSLLGGAIND
jgi:glycine/serine hydroxymethyltransferase